MGTSIGAVAFGVHTTIPAAAFQTSAGKPNRTMIALIQAPFDGASFPVPKPSQRRRSATRRVRADVGCRDSENGRRTPTVLEAAQKSDIDRLLEGISFGQLCDEFECVSSPAVERTARQLVKDIIDIREGQRSLSNFGVNVEYKDPIRSFKGRDKYRRANWIKTALENPTVAVCGMNMLSTSVLNIKWTIRGRPKLPSVFPLGVLLLTISSTFTMNQISGQVLLHEDEWNLSASHSPPQAYFWTTRLAFSVVQAGKDFVEYAHGLTKQLDEGDNIIYPDPSGDPRKVSPKNLFTFLGYRTAFFRTCNFQLSRFHVAQYLRLNLYLNVSIICSDSSLKLIQALSI